MNEKPLEKGYSISELFYEKCTIKGGWSPFGWHHTKDVQSAVRGALEEIRQLPNRDDQLYVKTGKKAINIKVLDGGGCGKFEVKDIINKWLMGEGRE